MEEKNIVDLAQATDLEVRILFASILDELRKRKIGFSLSRNLSGMDFELVISVSSDRKEVYVKWLQEDDGFEGLEEEQKEIDGFDEDLDYSLHDEDEEFYDDDDWIYDETASGRSPNDDRSDSMNPNSHRYNPGR